MIRNPLRPIEKILSSIILLGSGMGLVLIASSHLMSTSQILQLIAVVASMLFGGLLLLNKLHRVIALILSGSIAHFLAIQLLALPNSTESNNFVGFWLLVIVAWSCAWLFVDKLAFVSVKNQTIQRLVDLLIPILFGIWILIIWQLVVRGFDISRVLLPPPSEIGVRISNSLSILWADFKQTFLKSVLIGYVLGCGSGFVISVIIDRIPFLQRGLLPIGNFVSALPIIGIAPIMVMWFGFDWQSKAAVVVVMTFFPMLVNTTAGLGASDRMQIDLMRTYNASYWHALFKLKLPVAMPFIFNALKINSTLALIGAIVAEFFGTPIVGMGFRISTEVGRMNVDMVWAEIAVAALAGSLFYGLVAVIERSVTFWHPSIRR